MATNVAARNSAVVQVMRVVSEVALWRVEGRRTAVTATMRMPIEKRKASWAFLGCALESVCRGCRVDKAYFLMLSRTFKSTGTGRRMSIMSVAMLQPPNRWVSLD